MPRRARWAPRTRRRGATAAGTSASCARRGSAGPCRTEPRGGSTREARSRETEAVRGPQSPHPKPSLRAQPRQVKDESLFQGRMGEERALRGAGEVEEPEDQSEGAGKEKLAAWESFRPRRGRRDLGFGILTRRWHGASLALVPAISKRGASQELGDPPLEILHRVRLLEEANPSWANS